MTSPARFSPASDTTRPVLERGVAFPFRTAHQRRPSKEEPCFHQVSSSDSSLLLPRARRASSSARPASPRLVHDELGSLALPLTDISPLRPGCSRLSSISAAFLVVDLVCAADSGRDPIWFHPSNRAHRPGRLPFNDLVPSHPPVLPLRVLPVWLLACDHVLTLPSSRLPSGLVVLDDVVPLAPRLHARPRSNPRRVRRSSVPAPREHIRLPTAA